VHLRKAKLKSRQIANTTQPGGHPPTEDNAVHLLIGRLNFIPHQRVPGPLWHQWCRRKRQQALRNNAQEKVRNVQDRLGTTYRTRLNWYYTTTTSM